MATNSHAKRHPSDRLADRAATIAKDVQEVGDAAKRVAADGVDAIRETAHQYLAEGQSRVRHLGGSIQERVQDQPVKALLIAAGIGFLLGAIWIRR
jgi:ElaB/YqjD/DUF883 family membrane-anchored ribosome-binding protein